MFAGASLSRAGCHEYRRGTSARYEESWRASAFPREPSARVGPIYVFGDPLMQLLSERPAASPIHGFAWEIQPADMWERLARDLRSGRPTFVFVANAEARVIDERGPQVRQLIESGYRLRSTDSLGRWYERID